MRRGDNFLNIMDIHSYIVEKREENINILKKIAAQPSISAQDIGVKECAKMISELMKKYGINTKIYETKTQPVIFGEILSKNKDAVTILFYGHYDVQPEGSLEEWKTPPFEPTILNKRLYGRGTADNKGQFLAHILAVKSFLEVERSLPVNIKFVLEGEEESGSSSLPDFVKEHRDILAAELVYTSDGGKHDSGAPVVYFGVRGLLNVEIFLETAKHDNHSGNKGGVISNAAWELVNLLSSMKDKKGKITINGFYDNIVPPSEYELSLLDNIPYDPENLARVFGVNEISIGRREFYKRLTFEPTISINGLNSGYTGVGAKTIIPGSASVKMDIRLVNNQDPNDIFEKIKKHAIKFNPNIKVISHGHMFPSRTSVDLPICRHIIIALEKTHEQKPILIPVMGGSLPDYVWTNILGLPSFIIPYANADEANHAPNENIGLDFYMKGIHTSAQLIYELSKE
jgi:acetylornithine deacetylase/succinyl-diaminopimelate desuccinylase-like protein